MQSEDVEENKQKSLGQSSGHGRGGNLERRVKMHGSKSWVMNHTSYDHLFDLCDHESSLSGCLVSVVPG
jgi:hypothetical protein